MISYSILISILVIHWLADFVLQTHEQASKKAIDPVYLTKHVATYSMVWLWGGAILLGSFILGIYFAIITFLFHWVTDMKTSEMVKERFDAGDYHNGFVIIGADQILHYLQLLGTYYLLNQILP